jgi:hypothetical protein
MFSAKKKRGFLAHAGSGAKISVGHRPYRRGVELRLGLGNRSDS